MGGDAILEFEETGTWPISTVKGVAVRWIDTPTPTYDEISDHLPPLPEDLGRVFFYHRSPWRWDPRAEIHLNDEKVENCCQGFFFVDRPPGKYVASLREADSSSELGPVSFTLAAQETRFVQARTPTPSQSRPLEWYGVPLDGMRLHLSEPKVALKHLRHQYGFFGEIPVRRDFMYFVGDRSQLLEAEDSQ